VYCQYVHITYTMRYTFPYVLAHRFCSEDGSIVSLQNSDTRLPLDAFQLQHNPKYLDTTHCNHSAVSPDHQPYSHAASTQSISSVSIRTASSHFSDIIVSSCLEFPSQNYVLSRPFDSDCMLEEAGIKTREFNQLRTFFFNLINS
jgi:hypothetical protein